MTATIGIEEELLVIDAGTGDLVARGPDLLDAVPEDIGGPVVSELNRCQVETNTNVCHTLDEACAQLTTLRSGLVRAGGSVGVIPVALASHPWSAWHDQTVNTDTAHYRTLLNDYQQLARETVICGCHVHVGVDDPDDRILVMNTVTPWLPVLLALSANSPWWQGVDTGYASYRTLVWKSWPTATMPPLLRDYGALEGLIESLRTVEGIDDPSAIYWYVRPSAKLPTVEFRVADTCLRVEDAVMLAGLARALTETAITTPWDPGDTPPTALLDCGLWRAARYGLTGTLLDPTTATLRPAAEVVGSLLKAVRTALVDAGDYDLVAENIQRVMTDGNGATVQRAVLNAGPSSHPDAITAITSPRTAHD